jgi:hypothetical protein
MFSNTIGLTRKSASRIAMLTTTALLAACSGSSVQQSIVPTTTSVNPLSAKLQFAVGTANIAGVVGLNTLVTLRQTAAGYVGTSLLSNAPTITGPSGFVVPAATDAYGDAGTAMISSFIPTSVSSPPPQTTFDPDADGATGNYLASSYGFFPGVVDNSGLTPSLSPGPMPFYSAENSAFATSGPLLYIGGPPAFIPPGHPNGPQDGSFASGFYGYTLGFVDFQATPVSGSYGLNVVIPTGINTTTGVESYGSLSATATLNSTTVLPAWTTAPSFTTDGTGGGTITTNFTTPGAATEEYIELVDDGPTASPAPTPCITSGSYPYYYTFKVTPGVATVAVPDNIGAAEVGKTPSPTLCPGDAVDVYGFAVDYPLFSSAFPQSDGNAAPTITTTGQDDVTTSPDAGVGTFVESKHRAAKRLSSKPISIIRR